MNFANDSFDRFEVPSTSKTLLDGAKQWDTQAWIRLVKTYSPLIYYWCRKSDLPPDDSADVTQDVFLTLVRKLRDFRKADPKHRFRGWLQVITHSRIVDHFRRSGRTTEGFSLESFNDLELVLPDAEEEPSVPPSDRQHEINLFDKAVGKIRCEFKPKTWDAFWRFAVKKEPIEHVALELEITPNTVRKYKSRVMRRLRAEFGE